MSIETRHPLPARLHTLAAMAGLLERLEANPAMGGTGANANDNTSASADQYRSVALCVQALLEKVMRSEQTASGSDDDLHRLLRAAPHTAELYENLRYDVAGLCLHSLEPALKAEMAATALIRQARRA